ncbi:DUF4340 domain-containing protein [Candidatus Poribacteria bacterium]
MKFRNTLILFGIVVVLFLFVYVFEIRKPEESDGKSKNLGKTLQLERENINRIELSYADPSYETIVCSIDSNGQWQIEQPLKANADQKTVDRLISDAIGKSIHETLKEPGDLAEYGLDNPRVTATFQVKAGVSRTLMLGNTVPTGNYVYIKQKSEPDISLVPASIVDALTKFVSDLRDRTVIALDRANTHRIRLEYDNGKSIVCEGRDFGWVLVEPIAAKADASAIEAIISELNNLKVNRFVAGEPDDLSVYGLAQPQIKLTASLKDEEDRTLLIGSAENGSVYVKTTQDKMVFLVAAEIIDKLTKQPSDLRDKTVMIFDIGNVEKLELKYPERSVALDKKSDMEGEIWELTAPMSAKADESKVDEILKKLHELKAVEFVSDEPEYIALYGLTKPQIEALLSLEGAGTKTLLVGKKVEGSVYVKTAPSETVYFVDAGIVDDLTKSSLDLRDTQMMKFDRNDVKRIELKGKEETIICIKQERDWRIVEPIREKAKNYQVIDILRKLEGLKAEKFVTEKAARLSDYGLDQPDMTVTVTLKDDSTKTLLVGGTLPDSDSSYAKDADADVIFVIEKDVVDELGKSLSEIKE